MLLGHSRLLLVAGVQGLSGLLSVAAVTAENKNFMNINKLI